MQERVLVADLGLQRWKRMPHGRAKVAAYADLVMLRLRIAPGAVHRPGRLRLQARENTFIRPPPDRSVMPALIWGSSSLRLTSRHPASPRAMRANVTRSGDFLNSLRPARWRAPDIRGGVGPARGTATRGWTGRGGVFTGGPCLDRWGPLPPAPDAPGIRTPGNARYGSGSMGPARDLCS
jgi:hypothetical protein